MAQALLHQREQFGIVRRFGIDHAMGREPRLVEAGREQVPPAHHPQHRPPGARGDAGKEQGGGGIVARLRRRGGDLVQRVEPQPAVSEPRVERLRAEGQHLAPPMPLALDRAERFAQGGDNGLRHGANDSRQRQSFLFCSHGVRSQAGDSGGGSAAARCAEGPPPSVTPALCRRPQCTSGPVMISFGVACLPVDPGTGPG